MATTSRDALDWITRYIRDHKLQMGDPLPSEIEVTDRLEIGRSSVREAFAVLRAFGICRSKPGVGQILLTDSRQLDLMSLFAHDYFSLDEYLAFRQLRNFIELGSAELMMQRATPDQILKLRRLVEGISLGKASILTPLEFEIQFHEQLAMISGNRFSIALGLLYRPMFEYHTNHRLTSEDKNIMPKEVIATHERIVDALESENLEELKLALRGEWTEAMFFDDKSVNRSNKNSA